MPPAEFARFKASNGALRWCLKGEHLMPVSEFYKNRRAWDGLFDRCKARTNARQRAGLCTVAQSALPVPTRSTALSRTTASR